MIKNLELYFPYTAREAAKYEELSAYELLVTLTDGGRVIYDDLDKTLTYLRFDLDDPNEAEYAMMFGVRLRRKMREKRITQEELSREIGVSQPTFNKYLNGDVRIPLTKAYKLANALDCSLDDFFYKGGDIK